MRIMPAALAVTLLACSSPMETRSYTTVHVVPQPRLFLADSPPDPPVTPPVPVSLVVQTPPSAPPLVAVVDHGEALQVRCPPPARALAGTPVHLAAQAAGTGLRYRWTVTQSPQARYYRFSERFDANDSDGIVAMGAEVPFTSVIVGDYTVHAEVRDTDGRTGSCDTQVTMAGHGLRVELSWNTGNTDVDLHMVTGRDPRWVTPADCYYANRTPDMSVSDESRRRWLDTDDTDGEGPENIRVDAPELDTDYQVGVHFYSSHSQSGPTTAIVVIYCGEQRVAHFEQNLTANTNPDGNPFWRVGAVRFRPDGSCSVTQARGSTVTPQSALTNRGG